MADIDKQIQNLRESRKLIAEQQNISQTVQQFFVATKPNIMAIAQDYFPAPFEFELSAPNIRLLKTQHNCGCQWWNPSFEDTVLISDADLKYLILSYQVVKNITNRCGCSTPYVLMKQFAQEKPRVIEKLESNILRFINILSLETRTSIMKTVLGLSDTQVMNRLLVQNFTQQEKNMLTTLNSVLFEQNAKQHLVIEQLRKENQAYYNRVQVQIQNLLNGFQQTVKVVNKRGENE